MTYGMLKSLVKGLLIGDNVLPKEDDVVKALLSYAYNMIGNKTESFHLLTLNRRQDILRMAAGDYFIRVPELPATDLDELDVDTELGFVAARYMASMVSKDKMVIHVAAAEDLIRDYNAKVYQILEEIKYHKATGMAEFAGGRDFDDLEQVPDPGVIQ